MAAHTSSGDYGDENEEQKGSAIPPMRNIQFYMVINEKFREYMQHVMLLI